MMNKEEQIKKQISQIELQIKKISLHSSDSDLCSELCNSLILQKAILKKDLENLKKNPLINSIKKFLPKKDKLICDYFN